MEGRSYAAALRRLHRQYSTKEGCGAARALLGTHRSPMVGAAAATGRQFAACRWAEWLSFGPRIVAGGRYETPDTFATTYACAHGVLSRAQVFTVALGVCPSCVSRGRVWRVRASTHVEPIAA